VVIEFIFISTVMGLEYSSPMGLIQSKAQSVMVMYNINLLHLPSLCLTCGTATCMFTHVKQHCYCWWL